MISTSDFRTGTTIEIDGELYTVTDFQHVKPGKGSAFVRSKLKNIRSGSVTEKTFRAGEKVTKAHLERKKMQFLYNSGEEYIFMDNETYEQLSVEGDHLGDTKKYLLENMDVEISSYNGEVLGVDLPVFVELKVVESEPGVKGDTASGGTKPAKLETGLVVQVPFFINEGDILKIDTRIGEYIERKKES